MKYTVLCWCWCCSLKCDSRLGAWAAQWGARVDVLVEINAGQDRCGGLSVLQCRGCSVMQNCQ